MSGGRRNALVLVDGLNLLFRSHHALSTRPVSRPSDGRNISGLAGFCSSLVRVAETFQPKYLAIGMDSPSRSCAAIAACSRLCIALRLTHYSPFLSPLWPQPRPFASSSSRVTRPAAPTSQTYVPPSHGSRPIDTSPFLTKSPPRPPSPQDLIWQVRELSPLLDALGIPWAGCPGYEGDDVIGSLSRAGEQLAVARARLGLIPGVDPAAVGGPLLHPGDEGFVIEEGAHNGAATGAVLGGFGRQVEPGHDVSMMERLRLHLLAFDGALPAASGAVPTPLTCPSPSDPASSGFGGAVSAAREQLGAAEARRARVSLAALARSVEVDHVYIVSHDKDFMQLVSPAVTLVKPEAGGVFTAITPEGVARVAAVAPAQYTDYLALVGDKVDNIPGVRGIGPKYAAQLLTTYGTVERAMEAAAAASGRALLCASGEAFDKEVLAAIDRQPLLAAQAGSVAASVAPSAGPAREGMANGRPPGLFDSLMVAAEADAPEGEREAGLPATPSPPAPAARGSKARRKPQAAADSADSAAAAAEASLSGVPAWPLPLRLAVALTEHSRSFYLSRLLARIETRVPGLPALSDFRFEGFRQDRASAALGDMGVSQLASRFRTAGHAALRAANADRRKASNSTMPAPPDEGEGAAVETGKRARKAGAKAAIAKPASGSGARARAEAMGLDDVDPNDAEAAALAAGEALFGAAGAIAHAPPSASGIVGDFAAGEVGDAPLR